MAMQFAFGAMAQERDVLVRSEVLKQAQCEFLAVVLDSLVSLV